MCREAMMTQSVGVPLTAKRRSATGRSRKGSLSESECDTPDWSYSGATTQTSSESARAISTQASSPSEWMPSSLVTRMRMAGLRPLDGLEAAHVALQHVWNCDRAALLLIGLQHSNERAADRDARAVQRMDVAHLAILRPVARVHAAGLKLAADRAGRNLAIGVLTGKPHLDVIGLLRRKAHVAGAQRHHAIVQIEP